MTVAMGAVTQILFRFCVLNIVLLARQFIGRFTCVDIVDVDTPCYLWHQ